MVAAGKRWHLIELHEQAWFPEYWRGLVVDTLRSLWCEVPLPRWSMASSAADKLKDVLRDTGSTHIVDLCSGGGGPMPLIAERLQVQVTLTDLYPQAELWSRIAHQHPAYVTFEPHSVDATRVPLKLSQPGALRTFCLSLHHFRPELARKILQDAINRKTPIAIFEGQERTWLVMALLALFLFHQVLFLSAIRLVIDALRRPSRLGQREYWWRWVWMVIVPVVPLIVWFDGIISCLRTYSEGEFLHDLVAHCQDHETFEWKVERRPMFLGFTTVMSYVGTPRPPTVNAAQSLNVATTVVSHGATTQR